ncbi:MAG TPA: hypothetical protein VGT60_06850 [Candidatus Limnocylindria bacterium]|nr:hypothetical protein [Candidatus Limnocylindria bacterium]
MGLLELLIVVILLLWLFGYFGRGRFYGPRGGTAVIGDGGWLAGGSWIHLLLVVVVILVVLRLLGL